MAALLNELPETVCWWFRCGTVVTPSDHEDPTVVVGVNWLECATEVVIAEVAEKSVETGGAVVAENGMGMAGIDG